jgi:hypothetical protein
MRVVRQCDIDAMYRPDLPPEFWDMLEKMQKTRAFKRRLKKANKAWNEFRSQLNRRDAWDEITDRLQRYKEDIKRNA